MKKFYYFKLFQAVLAFVLLWQILSTEHLCGKFTSPQCFVSLHGHCNNKFTIFTPDATTTQLDLANVTEWIQMNEHPPTGDHCLPINISIVTSLRNAYNCATITNQLENTADVLARVLYLCLLFLFTLIFHTLVQQPMKQYDLCGCLCALSGIFMWCFSSVYTILLAVDWTALWECTNFRPYSSFLLFTLVLSVVLLCSSFYEMFSSSALLKESAATADTQQKQKQIVVDEMTPKISAIHGFNNDSSLTIYVP